MRYAFPAHPKKPGYFYVLDPQGTLVAELWEDHALVVCLMYENMLKQNERRANEFMYGHVLGMTQAMLYADRYPKITVKTGPHGEKILTAIDPILGEVFNGSIDSAPGAMQQAAVMLHKGFGKKEDEH